MKKVDTHEIQYTIKPYKLLKMSIVEVYVMNHFC